MNRGRPGRVRTLRTSRSAPCGAFTDATITNPLFPLRLGIRFAFCSVIAAASLEASAADRLAEWAQRLEEREASYERHTNDEMNDIVLAGMHSGDEAVVRRTVDTITLETQMVVARQGHIERPFSTERAAALREGLHRTRDFPAVPGLRDFLLDYVRQGVAKDGWGAAVAPRDFESEDMAERPDWDAGPGALLTYFPGDPEVEKLLLEFYRAIGSFGPRALPHAERLRELANRQFESAAVEDSLAKVAANTKTIASKPANQPKEPRQ